MLIVRDFSNMFRQMSGMPINSKGANNMLRQAGINTNSMQYKAAIKTMTSSMGGGIGYTNPMAIKNLMRNFDSDGNLLNAHGVAGMDATGKSLEERHRIINVSEDARQLMFDEVKRHFKQENGVANGDTTRRTEVFTAYQKSVPIEDRLKGTWTLGQYESNYRQAFYDACKAADPKWELGKSIPPGALDSVTRESVDSMLVKSNGQYGETLVRKSVDITV